MLRGAEAALARGDGSAAMDAFERAAGMQHAADIEMGIVRAHLQLGQYRRALAFCAHVAGAHGESPAASALYAWLLRAGGQEVVARRVLAAALAHSPDDATLGAVARAFAAPLPRPDGVLLDAPHRMAPFASNLGDEAPPAAARVVASGVLIDATTALAPAGILADPGSEAMRIWVRNGLGETVRARVDRSAQPLGDFRVIVLRLVERLDAPGLDATAAREPFAGSPGFVIEYAAPADAAPAWPWLRQGFVGAATVGGTFRHLGIDVADGVHGGPVLDASGRLAGIALHDRGGSVWLPAAQWRRAGIDTATTATAQGAKPHPPASTPIGADAAYERALRIALQVIVAP